MVAGTRTIVVIHAQAVRRVIIISVKGRQNPCERAELLFLHSRQQSETISCAMPLRFAETSPPNDPSKW